MVSFYCVVQYVPDPIANERLNVGIIAYDATTVASRFVHDWRRVRAFGEADIGFLRDFARDIESSSSDQGMTWESLGVRHLTGTKIEEMARRWTNAIQLTPPCVSSLPVTELVEDMAPLFLRQPATPIRSTQRNRAQAAELVTREIESALKERLGTPATKQLLRVGKFVNGEVGRHRLDFQLANGHLMMAGHALSFEGPENEWLRKDVHSTAWAFKDLAAKDPSVERAVVLLPPAARMDTYDEARETFRALEVKVVAGADLPQWSEETALRAARRLSTGYLH